MRFNSSAERMMAYLVLVALFFTWSSGTLWSTLRTSTSDGAWGSVVWVPAGLPQPGDTVVVNSHISDIPAGVHGVIIIQAGASLVVPSGIYYVPGVQNSGDLTLLPGVLIKTNGDLSNAGTIHDAGAIEITAHGAVVSGSGSIPNLVLNAGTASVVRAGSSLTIGTLYVAAGELQLDSNDITVNAGFSSDRPLGSWGITATTGTITLNGPVYGSAQGKIRLGWVTGGGTRKSPLPPTTYGMLGSPSDTITFTASRKVSYCELLGTVLVDSGAVVTAEGIGAAGINTVHGTLRNYGRLTAADRRYRWKVEEDFFNYGTVDLCTVLMTGQNANLRTDSGTWGGDASLSYRASSGGRLQLDGSITLPSLEILPFSDADSGIAVDAGANEIVVRHTFVSDRARNCRLLCDSIVRLRNDADGIIQGNVSFEGFYDSEIEGMFGGIGRKVTMSMPKRFVGPVSLIGTFIQTPNAKMVVRSTMTIPPGTTLTANVMVDTGGTLIGKGDVTIVRGMGGGGILELIGYAPTLEVRAPIVDSVLVSVGRDTMATNLVVPRTFAAPRMTIHCGSRMNYPSGVTVNVSGEFRYRLAVQPGFSLISAAVHPADPTPQSVFPGADSIFTFNDTLGYVEADSIVPGRGYWVFFPDSAVIEQRGTILNPPTASDIVDGWNLLGGASVPVKVEDIVPLLTMRTSPFYTFLLGGDPNSGYGEATYLEPGRGYLVQFAGPGIIVRQ